MFRIYFLRMSVFPGKTKAKQSCCEAKFFSTTIACAFTSRLLRLRGALPVYRVVVIQLHLHSDWCQNAGVIIKSVYMRRMRC